MSIRQKEVLQIYQRGPARQLSGLNSLLNIIHTMIELKEKRTAANKTDGVVHTCTYIQVPVTTVGARMYCIVHCTVQDIG